MKRKTQILSLILMVGLLLMTACQDNNDNNEEVENAGNNKQSDQQNTTNAENETITSFPLTMEIEGKEVTVEEKPEKIAALSLNVADTVMDLAGPESLVTVTTSMEQENLSHFSEEAKEINNKIAGATSLDPEEVISYDPDLILLTLTHGAEEDADEMLLKAGIPLASFSRWVTVKDLMQNYENIGQLIGEEEKATQIIEDMQTKIDDTAALFDADAEKPTVLMLSQVGSTTGPYILGPSSIAYDLIELAGGQSGSDLLDLEKTTAASIEHIIEMDPDYIILVEWSATSDEFTEMVESDGFQTLSAVQNDNVKHMKAKDISQANRFVVDQLEDLATWLHEN